MTNLYTGPKSFTPVQPVMTFWEDGDWLRIQSQDGSVRYLHKHPASDLLRWIGFESQKEKSELVLTP
jgi:hypothetical protein